MLVSRLRRTCTSRSGDTHRPTISGPSARQQLRRQRHARHQRHIGGADAADGEIDTGRRLGGAAGAGQDDFGLVDRVQRLAVVMWMVKFSASIRCEIALVHFMLARRPVGFRRAQELAQRRDRAFQHVEAAHIRLSAQRAISSSRSSWLARVKNTSPGMMAI